MIKRTIFVCHSSHDEAVVASLKLHLEPLFNSSDLTVWDDALFLAGERWDDKIHREIENAIAAIILVTPQLLKSKYVRETEIPAFLEKTESTGLTLYILFVDHSVVDEVEFDFIIDGQQASRKLTDYHGLNSPDRPILDNNRKVQNRLLAEAAKRIFKELDGSLPTRTKTLTARVLRKPILGRKTVHVIIEWTEKHNRYKKYIKKSTKLAVHWNEDINLDEGDNVEIKECRPLSKTKHHVLLRKIV
jgi:small subunit ribosomal protein S17